MYISEEESIFIIDRLCLIASHWGGDLPVEETKLINKLIGGLSTENRTSIIGERPELKEII